MKNLNKIFKLYFPLWYASKIKLTTEQEEENNKLYNDPDLFIMGEEMVVWEYEQKTGCCLMTDMLIAAILMAFTLALILIPIIIRYSTHHCTR